MFIPLHDANDFRYIRVQYVTLAIIAANVIVYLVTSLGTEDFVNAAVFGFGYIPSTIFDIAERPPEMVIVPDDWTFLTYSFLHGDIWHLGGNMLFLWVFGDNVEDVMGHVRYLIFYLLTGVAAGLIQVLTNTDSTVPLIGASGAISGLLAAYIVCFPNGRVVTAVVFGFFITTMMVPAWIMIGYWILLQVIQGVVSLGIDADTGGVAWFAHIGGFAAGLVLVFPFRRADRVAFQRAARERPETRQRRVGWGD